MPVKTEAAVVREGEWHRVQPILLNRFAPFCVDGVGDAGVAGAESRMNAAKFSKSANISDTVPMGVLKFGLLGLPFRMLLESSGVELNTQPGTALRSFGNNSVETPCSTL